MMHRYTFVTGRSRFTVQAFATGVLSFLGHSPTFAVRQFSGSLSFDPDALRSTALELSVDAESLALLDQVSANDRAEIEGRMCREVLETSVHRTVTFRADNVAVQPFGPDRFRLDLGGPLALHGVTHDYHVVSELLLREGGIQLRGEDRLAMSDFHIRPVSAVGGTIRLKDEVKLSFDLLGLPEAS